MNPTTEAELAWRELVFDALASDGPIRDSDVKDAVRRNRPRIERQARREAYAKVRAAVLRDVTHEAVAARMATVGAPWVVREGVKTSVDAVLAAIDTLMGDDDE